MADTLTDDVLDAILRESDGYWPPARERIQALIREHDAALIEKLADEVLAAMTPGVSDDTTGSAVFTWLREKARQRREGQS